MDRTMEQMGAVQALAGVADAAQRLLAGSLALARTRLQEEAHVAARKAAVAAMVLVPAIVGWGLVCGAAAFALAGTLGPTGALLLLGALNGAAAMALFVQGMKRVGAATQRTGSATDPPDERREAARPMAGGTHGGH